MRLRTGAVIGVLAAIGMATSVQAADYDGHVHHRHHHRWHNVQGYIGACVRTHVETIGSVAPGSPPLIRYEDGVMQAYDPGLLGQTETQPGDPIQLCLVAFTRDCGGLFGGDLQPGRTYATGNLRTGAAWTQPDVRSSCARR